MPTAHSRRRILGGLSAAGAAAALHISPALAAETPPETTTLRPTKSPAICIAPQYAADELLRAEGFTDIRYVALREGQMFFEPMARGEADFGASFVGNWLFAIDAGTPVVILAAMHVGCYRLFAQEPIRRIAEFKGGTVGLEASPPSLMKLIAAEVGLNPAKDIRFVTTAGSKTRPLDLFVEGRIDAFLGFPPEPQELRARKAGHVILDTSLDRPWSNYFCCMVGAARDYVRNHPVATKRAIRAILKATDLCVADPGRIARRLVDGGFAPRFDYANQTLNEVPYDKWREYDAEDTVRFYALRLYEAGLIKTSPNKIIAGNTDWRFFNELKRELKA